MLTKLSLPAIYPIKFGFGHDLLDVVSAKSQQHEPKFTNPDRDYHVPEVMEGARSAI